MLTIKILGTGCPNCKRLEKETRRVLEAMDVKAEVVKVNDMQEILAYDVFSTPGLVIEEHVVSSGQVPSQETLRELIADAL